LGLLNSNFCSKFEQLYINYSRLSILVTGLFVIHSRHAYFLIVPMSIGQTPVRGFYGKLLKESKN